MEHRVTSLHRLLHSMRVADVAVKDIQIVAYVLGIMIESVP